MDRRQYLSAALGLPLAAASARLAQAATPNPISREAVLRDKEIPVFGNPDGDVTLVEYFDYQCSYCKAIAPVLAKLAEDDGGLRIVLKDWPVFGVLSMQAARLVLAAKYQDKFHDAHAALMAKTGRLTESRLIETLRETGIDMERLNQTLQTHDETIKAILVRNAAQAEAFGFQGTPSFIVGTFRIPGVPTEKQFRQMIADVRAGKDKAAQ